MELLKQQKEVSVKAHKKTPRKPGVREEMLSGLKKEVVEYLIPEEEVCPKITTEYEAVLPLPFQSSVTLGRIRNFHPLAICAARRTIKKDNSPQKGSYLFLPCSYYAIPYSF